jgi:transposase/signal recognition particle subunit SEC65
MSKQYRTYQPNQCYLMPPSLDEWLPQDHLARFVNEIVDELDLSAIYASYEQELKGYPPYHPGMMMRVLLYAYAVGVYSSRKIERRIHEDIAFRYLAAGNFPDFRTINTYRKRHLKEFRDLFVQVLQLCRQAGLVKLGTIAVDGTKFKANASIHKAMSYGRMQKEETRLQAEIDELLRQVEQVNNREDKRFGDRRGDELPEELAIREKRLAKIREAKKALEAEAKARAEAEAKEKEPDDHNDHSDPPDDSTPVVDEKAQRNFTDPDSRVQKDGKTFIQGFNAQVAVDAETQVILGALLRTSSADVNALPTVLDEVIQLVGTPDRVVADAGYYSQNNLDEVKRRHMAPFIPPNRVKHSEWRKPASRGPLPKTPRERMARFLRTKRGREIYRLRQISVEPVFGQIKEARGFRRFSLRGHESVTAEFMLVVSVHNLLKLFRHQAGRTSATAC